MLKATVLRTFALLMAVMLFAAACGSDDDDADSGDAAPTTTTTDVSDTAAYAVDTTNCPEEATAPIEGRIKIGTTLPLSGGPAAAAFAPLLDGMRNYIAYANEQGLVPGYVLELVAADDQYNPTLTTSAVEKLIDEDEVHLMTGMAGTPNNFAVRDVLNEECYPQLFALSGAPTLGDPENFPWTMGGLAPYTTETKVYVDNMRASFPDGATVGIFTVANEFGDYYADTMEAAAADAGLEIVVNQTIETADSNPPTAQVSEIAKKTPDIILAVPLGIQCPTFLNELANAKAANPGWSPRLYITSTCASPILLTIAGAAGDGLLTIATGIDVTDPKNAENPAVKRFKEVMLKHGFKPDGDFGTASGAWTLAESTVAVIAQAVEAGELTRASILNAARALDYSPSLIRDGIALVTEGVDDGFAIESFQIIQWDADSKTYADVGSVISEFEGTTVAE